jgi:tRNA G18 (ribose-2'-O)-methylase SpoU
MGGERWLPLEQVAPSQLPFYLRARRAAGWRVVALEQAHGSVPLHSYARTRAATADDDADGCSASAGGAPPSLAARTVLLLGAEGTGVPPSLLAEVDGCVEIPQRGLLRSLNVHVSAAIAVWEMGLRHEDNLVGMGDEGGS